MMGTIQGILLYPVKANQNIPMGTRTAPSIAGINRNSGFESSSFLSLPRRNQFVKPLMMGREMIMPPNSPIPRPRKESPTNWRGNWWFVMKTRGKASKKRYKIERRKAVYMHNRRQIGSRVSRTIC